MLIDVTKNHIKNGVREDECNCPIALAVCDAVEFELSDNDIEFNNIITVVHDDNIAIYYYTPDKEYEYQFNISPKKKDNWSIISDFIFHFDKDRDVEPLDMEFEVNQEVHNKYKI